MRNRDALVLICCLGTALLRGAPAEKPQESAALNQWLAHQQTVDTWTADVKQTRKLKVVKRPLTTPGRIWFVGPRRFRWELGQPVRTLAFRREQQLLVLYPQLKRAEKYEFASVHDPALQQARLLMDVGFPAEPNAFHREYELLDQGETETVHRFSLRPRQEQARSLLTGLTLQVRKSDWALLETEMQFPDGSSMSNTFTGHQFNIELPDDILEPDLEGYTLEEPLKGR